MLTGTKLAHVAIYNLRLTYMKTYYDESSPCLLYRFEMDDDFDDEIFLSTARNHDHEKVESAVCNLKSLDNYGVTCPIVIGSGSESRHLQKEK